MCVYGKASNINKFRTIASSILRFLNILLFLPVLIIDGFRRVILLIIELRIVPFLSLAGRENIVECCTREIDNCCYEEHISPL